MIYIDDLFVAFATQFNKNFSSIFDTFEYETR